VQAGPPPLVWVGFLAFFVVALVVGVRLLALAYKTRRLPDFCIGVGVLGIGPVGFGAQVAAMQVPATSPGLARGLVALAFVAVAAGVGCKLVFNWRVYHPERRGFLGLVALVGAAYLIMFAGQVRRGLPAVPPMDWAYYLRMLFQVGALLWGSAEALWYWGMMRRRVRIGLADPVVTNRFLLWGIGAFAAGFGTLVGTVVQIVTGVPTTEEPWVLASSSAHGLVAALAMGLAFVPPAAYTRMISRHSPA
jgi:hypothetical protein